MSCFLFLLLQDERDLLKIYITGKYQDWSDISAVCFVKELQFYQTKIVVLNNQWQNELFFFLTLISNSLSEDKWWKNSAFTPNCGCWEMSNVYKEIDIFISSYLF